jgi:hypothetical protein
MSSLCALSYPLMRRSTVLRSAVVLLPLRRLLPPLPPRSLLQASPASTPPSTPTSRPAPRRSRLAELASRPRSRSAAVRRHRRLLSSSLLRLRSSYASFSQSLGNLCPSVAFPLPSRFTPFPVAKPSPFRAGYPRLHRRSGQGCRRAQGSRQG